jgi:hypothetical protein
LRAHERLAEQKELQLQERLEEIQEIFDVLLKQSRPQEQTV